MQPSLPFEDPKEHVISPKDIKEACLQAGMILSSSAEPTLNSMGFTYHEFGPPEEHWLSSLPESDLPLLDVGACYGVQTIHAMKSGRDVIALDMCKEHMSVLHERVAKLRLNDANAGKLIRTVVAKLPAPGVIGDASVAGILCAEVIHFCTPGELRSLFQQFFQWLSPGGRLVVTAGAWPPQVELRETQGYKLREGLSAKQALKMLETLSPSEVIDAAPGMMMIPDDDPWNKILGDFFNQTSTEELRELAESSGFEVEEVKYYNAEKYEDEKSGTPLTALLIARRPVQKVE